MSLIAKTKGAPHLTTLHDTMNTMHTEVKAAAKGTAIALESIREELKDTATKIQRSIAIGEEVKTAAKEATDIGKIVAGMAREIMNKGPH
jgi:hypothetical protein